MREARYGVSCPGYRFTHPGYAAETVIDEGRMIAIPILALATAVVILWSGIKFQTAYVALIDALPPQFQDGLSSKFAFPEYVLRPSTPLATQADYVESQVGFCFAALGIALLCFLYENAVVGSIVLAIFLGYAVLTFKSWRTYQSNCNRRPSREDEERP